MLKKPVVSSVLWLLISQSIYLVFPWDSRRIRTALAATVAVNSRENLISLDLTETW
jgi:hypothetical protein